MAHAGKHPFPVDESGTGKTTITGSITGTGTAALTTATMTQYRILAWGSGTNFSIIAAGAANTICTSNGGSASASFKTPGYTGCALVYVSSLTASSSATIDFTSSITSTYATYRMLISNVYPVTDNVNLNMLMSTNNGSSWIATNYKAGSVAFDYATGVGTSTNSTTLMPLGGNLSNVTSDAPFSGYIDFYNFPLTPNNPEIKGAVNFTPSAGSYVGADIIGTNTANVQINAVRFSMSSGNISSGTFTLFGIRDG